MTTEKLIKIIDTQYNLIFTVPDGGHILVNGKKYQLQYLDDTHFRVIGGWSYHSYEFAEKVKAAGIQVELCPEGYEQEKAVHDAR